MNKVILLGNLVSNPEMRETPNGKTYTGFTVAVARGYKKADGEESETDFVKCTAWGKVATNITNYCKKGSKVLVEGALRVENYKNKEGGWVNNTFVNAYNCTFLSRKDKDMVKDRDDDSGFYPVSDEEIPF